ncbi:MAG: IS110 family RNA-guided transposase [Limisphaerales bacterium]
MLKEMNVHVGAIDVGSERLHAAVYGGETRVFSTFTSELHELARFFKEHGVTSVAMEATGVYWIVPHDVLEQSGLKVVVVNGAHVKNLPGRKSDMSDPQWLAELHAHGLLSAGFVPEEAVRRLRDYQRLRQDHIQMGSTHILHMQKALDRMNLKLHEVISQITGWSGQRIIEAILAGERDPEKLASLCDGQILEKKRQRLIESLRGFWRAEHLFALRQAWEGWHFYQKQIRACDQEIAQILGEITPAKPQQPSGSLPDRPTELKRAQTKKAAGKRIHHHAPQIPQLHQTLLRLCGGENAADLPTLTDYTVMQIIAETGTDMSRWPTVKHFTAWLGLAPSSRQSGKRRKSEKRFRGRAGQLFCVAARSLARSKHLALGGFYRRIRATRGGQVANIAAARKVAELFYCTLRYGLNYVEQGLEQYNAKYKAQSIRRIQAAARRFGLTVQPLASPEQKPASSS